MIYNNQSELLALLRREGLYTDKSLGQNFLHNNTVIEKIVESANILPTDTVIEVGPGLGILTSELLKKAGKVIAIEMDHKLIPYLQKTFKDHSNFELVHDDVLKYQPPEKPYKVVANIPYYITSPIISHFLNIVQNRQPELMILLTQWEVAQKICVKEGDHTVLSLQTQIFANPKLICKVAAGNFTPAPKVDSAILKLETLKEPRIANPEKFIKIIKRAFSQKRKTLLNTLTGWAGIPKSDMEKLLIKASIEPKIRPQELSFQDWNSILTTLPN